MQMRPRHRREVVEEILDIRVLTHMDILTRNQQTELGKQIIEARHQCDLIESKHELQTKHFNDLKNRSTGDIDIKKAKLQENKDATESYLRKTERLEEEYKELETSVSDRPQYETKLKQLEKLETKIEQNLETHTKSLQFFEQNDNCPTCTQKIEETFREEKITKEKTKVTTLNQGMKDLVAELAKVEGKITEFNGISEKLYENKISISKVESSLKELKRFSDSLHNEILLLEGKDEDDKDIEQSLVKFTRRIRTNKN